MCSTHLERELKRYFGYDAFKMGQKEILQDIMAGSDVFGILPTGTGKSLCYQLPAKLLNGLTIVVTPLVSLMMDQVKQLQAMHYKSCAAINSFVSWKEKQEIYRNLHMLDLVYVSPELLQQEEAKYYFSQVKIALFVVDEAHCISQWGHEFRTDYLKLGEVARKLGSPQMLALSATAAPEAVEEIIQVLDRPRIKQHIHPMDRDNIGLVIERTASDQEKLGHLTSWLEKGFGPSLIYFSSRNTCEDIASKLIAHFPNRRIAFYHGGMDQTDRILVQQQFMNGQLDYICCTSAFGMGINKSDIRLVLHYHFPSDIESFIQEIGRAGRDGKESISVLLYSEQDIHLQSQLLQNELPDIRIVGGIVRMIGQLSTTGRSDIGLDPEFYNLFQLTETQWRFLYYQFEKHGMIRDNRIIFDQEKYEINTIKITDHIENRLRHKEAKLGEMLAWLHERGCLRVALYKHFQPTCTIPESNCCINCGLDLDKIDKSNFYEETPYGNWEEQLKQLLFGV